MKVSDEVEFQNFQVLFRFSLIFCWFGSEVSNYQWDSLDSREYSESVLALFPSFIHLTEVEVKVLPEQWTIP